MASSPRARKAEPHSVRLPEYVEGDKIEASYSQGVLTITVPKAQAARPRKIEIKA